jgi:hypothetical protein
MTHRLMAVVAVLGLASGCIVTSDGDGGEGGLGGSSTGGSPTTGGNTTDGGGGSTANASGGGGAGGGTACMTSDDCPPATAVCTEALCDTVCSVIVSAEGVLCEVEGGGAGFCNGDEAAPACVECLSDADCNGGTCNLDTNVCEGDEPLGGVCGQNFCQLLPADNECAACLIGNQECAAERTACATDMVAGSCDNCGEWLNGGGDDFCAGSLDKAQAFLNCVCTPGVCAE